MNTRVILNSVLVFVIVAALAGCIKVEFVNPNETGKSEFEVQAPTVAPTELPPTDEALPTATSKPTVTPKPEAVYVRIIEVLSEKFDNPDSDFGQNPNNWANEFYDAARLSNDNGAARFELYGDDWDLFRIRTTKLWKISEANIFESKLKLDSNSNNGQCRAHVLMQISVPLSPGKNWYTTCGLLEEDKFPAA